MVSKKSFTRAVVATLLTGSVVGMGALSPAGAHAMSKTDTVFHTNPHKVSINAKEKMIENGTAAKIYLRHQLNMDTNEDIVFSDMGGQKKDNKGSYYEIKLTSKSMQNNGGTGTVDIYKVYQDGTYKSEY
ncbi:hypothetical protein ACFSMW_17795 [Virgibacillus halophilus]|uniref:Uncharacterized protein n=1 Tax=Tigheibacillus halophilus TaxID=361280 RepID=A0ABU5C2L3_9BACI|nr:hypothetical protein [Virgibacillus halophilus]